MTLERSWLTLVRQKKGRKKMNKSNVSSAVAAVLCLGLAAPTLAAESVVTGAATPTTAGDIATKPDAKPAAACLNDLH